ncbi:MAG: hypothetical protein OHK0026_14460 [Rhodocyclaceae bacterium]
MIEAPFRSLDAWVSYLSHTELPVLRTSARALAELAGRQDTIAGRDIGAVVLRDPLLATRVLSYIESHRNRARSAEISTIGHAIMMLGIEPFFRSFSDLPVVEDRLSGTPQALLGLLTVVGRARHAAHWARDWAALRHDLDAEEITVAALLHELAEILLWCVAPALSLHIRGKQEADRALRSRDAQRAVLGITLLDLQLALARAWHLPELLLRLMDDEHAANPRMRNVALAVRLARHSAAGWNDAALPDDYRDIATLLGLPLAATLERIGVPEHARAAVLDSPGVAVQNAAQSNGGVEE